MPNSSDSLSRLDGKDRRPAAQRIEAMQPSDLQMALLSIEDLVVKYKGKRGSGPKAAVRGVNLQIGPGETVGLVGESGCGKTTIARAILKLIEPTAGRIVFEGIDVSSARRNALQRFRHGIQLIFQDPGDSLNARMKVGQIVAEPILIQEGSPYRKCKDKVRDLIRRVGLNEDVLERFPLNLSGGQRQRIGIARALSTNPKLIVCDEPVSALDVSVQAQILNQLSDIQEEFGLAYLMISHDLAVVRHISRRIAVMYLGKIVEVGPADTVCRDPSHPYTVSLLDAVPVENPSKRRARKFRNHDADAIPTDTHGCSFSSRCEFSSDRCVSDTPKLVQVGGPGDGHLAACHHSDQLREARTI